MSALQEYVQFVSDDEGYFNWLQENPHGLVVNSHRVPESSYLMLYRASCTTINTPDRTNWTTTGYIKTCSAGVTALVDWADREVGGALNPGGTCRPVLGARPVSSPAPQQTIPERSTFTAAKPTPFITPSPTLTGRTLPSTISTACAELDLAWRTYASMILNRSHILIPDTEDDLNWHAFLGHSIDMQGFRAAEFVGVDPLTRSAPKFVPLKPRGIGVPQLAGLWEIPEIRRHLLGHSKDAPLADTLGVLRKHGGEIGVSLVEAFEFFPWRKFHWSARASFRTRRSSSRLITRSVDGSRMSVSSSEFTSFRPLTSDEL